MKKIIVAVTVWPLTELYYLIPGRFDFPFFVTVLMALIFLQEVDMKNLIFDFSAPVEDDPILGPVPSSPFPVEAKKESSHFAKLENSPRLQRLHALMSDGIERTTLEIMQSAKICAVNSAIYELRRNGFDIDCKKVGQSVYSYQLKGAAS